MRIGAKLANVGPQADRFADAAVALERVGVDSLWLSDRIVTTNPLTSSYPFTPDGSAPWTDRTPFVDAVVAMTVAATRTSRVEIGTGVLVLPLRAPVLLAQQLAAIDHLSGGRVALGIGVGWMSEEFALLGVPWAERAARTDEAVAVLRSCWEGDAEPVPSARPPLPAGVFSYPVPAHRIPILTGGMTRPALDRAGRTGGWFGYLRTEQIDGADLARSVDRVVTAARDHDPTAPRPRCVLRAVGDSDAVVALMPELIGAGIDDVIVDLDWTDEHDAGDRLARLREAAAHTRVGEPAAL